jgi:hypothetical protein
MRKLASGVGGSLSLDSERGVTAIEYGLIATLIAGAIISGRDASSQEKPTGITYRLS